MHLCPWLPADFGGLKSADYLKLNPQGKMPLLLLPNGHRRTLFFAGKGGVGKTSLLHEYARLCVEAEARSYYLDARNFESTPESFLAALRAALNLPDDKSVLHSLAEQPHTHVFLIDTTEILQPIDTWLRDVCLPQLPENTLVVMAGRESPSAAWHSDAGWQTLIRVLPLRNLAPDESRAYLSKREVPVDQGRNAAHADHAGRPEPDDGDDQRYGFWLLF